MPSAMDRSLQQHQAPHLAPGGLLELDWFPRFGTQLPIFKHAPPTLVHFFAKYCASHADKPFLVDGSLRISFAEAHAAAQAVARRLVGTHAIAPGERVGIAARNSASWVIAYMAVLMAGGCAALLNGWWTGGELSEAIDLAGCRIVLADHQRAQRLAGENHEAQVVTFAHGIVPQAMPAEFGPDGLDGELPDTGPDDLATILFTSGSTGMPKGVVSDHRAVVHAVLNFAAQTLAILGHMTAQDDGPAFPPASLVGVPLFHVTAEIPLFLQSFVLGRKLVMLPKWDPLEAMRLIEAEQVTYFVGVPLMSYELAAHPERDKFDLSSCKTFAAGGAPRPVEHIRQIREAMPSGYPILGYGLTETNAVGCGNFNENYLAKPASTGPASEPLVELAIIGEDGAPLAAGATGEVAIRSICNFLGYWGDPEATRNAVRDDGYFLTGDLGYLDEDNYLFIVDRKKDIIIRGGENISCTEVELAIYAHPEVAECAVFSLPDDRLGEVPAAVWLPRSGHRLSEDGLREFLAGRLAPFKIPVRFWQEMQSLPRLGTEKVDKRALREKYSALSGNREK